ncbi:MAG: hypothetical protein WAN36_05430 [Calditrichia bacterium]
MTRMPEVYDDINTVKENLKTADETIIYASPEAAQWLVDHEYEVKLRWGQAVKISKWENEIEVEPVRWERNPDTSQWYWRLLGEPFRRQLKEGEQL